MKKYFLFLFIALSPLILPGCAQVKIGKTLFPTFFGCDEIEENLYVDSQMPDSLRAKVKIIRVEALKRVKKFYGSIEASPKIIACFKEGCYQKFAGKYTRAKSHNAISIVLSPRALNVALLAHELSHSEYYVRIGGAFKMKHAPWWFNDGLAVVVSEAHEHSEEAWKRIILEKIPAPRMEELKTLDDWHAAIQKYRKNKKLNPSEHNVVYAAAGYEVREWLVCVGRKGLLRILSYIEDGRNFSRVYNEELRANRCEARI